MKLEKWALVSEIVSGLAVIVTLVILVVEVRDNTSTLKASAAATSRDSMSSMNDLDISLSDEKLSLFMRSQDPEATWGDFTDVERYWLTSYQRAFFRRGEAQYFRFRDGLLDADVWQTIRARIWRSTRSPIDREIWQRDRESVYTQGFADSIDSYQPDSEIVDEGSVSE